jgi:hypothetical protein
MNRFPDWPERLAEAIEVARTMPFTWGAHDCVLFAANAVESYTGVDYAHAFRGYRSEVGARRLIAQHGGTLEVAVSAVLGEPIPTALAGRGDVVLADLDHGQTLGLCLGNECAFAGVEGLLFLPRTAARAAWRV